MSRAAAMAALGFVHIVGINPDRFEPTYSGVPLPAEGQSINRSVHYAANPCIAIMNPSENIEIVGALEHPVRLSVGRQWRHKRECDWPRLSDVKSRRFMDEMIGGLKLVRRFHWESHGGREGHYEGGLDHGFRPANILYPKSPRDIVRRMREATGSSPVGNDKIAHPELRAVLCHELLATEILLCGSNVSLSTDQGRLLTGYFQSLGLRVVGGLKNPGLVAHDASLTVQDTDLTSPNSYKEKTEERGQPVGKFHFPKIGLFFIAICICGLAAYIQGAAYINLEHGRKLYGWLLLCVGLWLGALGTFGFALGMSWLSAG